MLDNIMSLRIKTLGLASAVAVLSWLSASQIPILVETDTARTVTRAMMKDFSAFVQHVMKAGEIPGLSVGIVRSDGHFWHGAWGNKTEDGEAMTTDTLFNLASCSKAFLTSSVGILMDDFEQGRNVTPLPSGLHKFDWHTKVAGLVPEWQLMDEWASAKATVGDILSHVSGLPRHDWSYKPDDSLLGVIHKLKHLRPAFELRERWSYNNIMYMLGAHMISTYSGMPYTEFISRRIFKPLNMNSTTFSIREASDKLTQTWSIGGRRIPYWFTEEMTELNAGPGGIISNVEDMTKWLAALLHAGVDPSTNTTIIPRTAFDEIITPYAVMEDASVSSLVSIAGYAYGWSRSTYRGHDVVSHPGGIPGFSTLVTFLPSDGLGIVVLMNTNTKTGSETLAITSLVVDTFLGLERSSPEKVSASSIADPGTDIDTARMQSRELAAEARLSLPLEAYTGTYFDAGYGNITFCSRTSTSEHCKQVLADFSHFEGFPPRDSNTPSPAVLYAVHPSIWVSHLRLQHQSKDTFTLMSTYLFPHGYGRNESAFQMISKRPARGEFVVEAGEVIGVGLFDIDIVGELTGRQRVGGIIQEISDIWFEKL